MRKRGGQKGCFWGYAAVIVGACIFMVLLLPAWFWWGLCGCCLLFGGIWILRH